MLPHLRTYIKMFRKIVVESRSVPGYSSCLEGNFLCGWLPGYLEKGLRAIIFIYNASPQKVKIRRSFWTSAYTNRKTPGHIAEDLDHRQHLCNNLEARRKIAALCFFLVLCSSLLQFLSHLLGTAFISGVLTEQLVMGVCYCNVYLLILFKLFRRQRVHVE